MSGRFLPLTLVRPHRLVTLVSITSGQELRRRLTEMGLNKGVRLRVVHSSQSGPCIVSVGDTRLVLGRGMAQNILVKED